MTKTEGLQTENLTETATGIILVGGAGTNVARALTRLMKPKEHKGLRLLTVNTDARLLSLYFPQKNEEMKEWEGVHSTHALGQRLTKGHGAGTKPEVGRQAAEEPESKKIISEFIDKVDNCIVLTGLGGGTGTGAGVYITSLCKEKGKPTVCMPITPDPEDEGMARYSRAVKALQDIRELGVPTIQIDNSYLTEYLSKVLTEEKGKTLTQQQAWDLVNEHSIVPMIYFLRELLHVPGDIISSDQANWETFVGYGDSLFIGWVDIEPTKIHETSEEKLVEELWIGHFQNRAIVENGKAMIFLCHGAMPFQKKKQTKVLMRKRICGDDQDRTANFETIEGSVEQVTDGKIWVAVAVIAKEVPFISPVKAVTPVVKTSLQSRHAVSTRTINYTVDGISRSKEVPTHLAQRFVEFNANPRGTQKEMEILYDEVNKTLGEKIDIPDRFLSSQQESATGNGRKISFHGFRPN